MNRRQFFKGFAATAAVVAIPFQWVYAKVFHRLRGDGISDDTAAMQALVDGEPVLMPDGRTVQHHVSGQPLHLPAGTYRIDASIMYRNPAQTGRDPTD